MTKAKRKTPYEEPNHINVGHAVAGYRDLRQDGKVIDGHVIGEMSGKIMSPYTRLIDLPSGGSVEITVKPMGCALSVSRITYDLADALDPETGDIRFKRPIHWTRRLWDRVKRKWDAQ